MTSCSLLKFTAYASQTLRSAPLVAIFLILGTSVNKVASKARMMEPPMRSSYWRSNVSRENIHAPVNVNDESLNCGGFEYQWTKANGECGACGDKMDGFHENEYPGKYSQFPPQKTYRTKWDGQTITDNDGLNIINVTIYLTPNQLGYFIFRLCTKRDGPGLDSLADCFKSRSPLIIRESNSIRYFPGSAGGYHDLHLLIPPNVSCDHCILQWTYVTGYREGRNGQCETCLGCGPQETYVNCADIQILPVGATSVKDENINSVTARSTPPTTTTAAFQTATTTRRLTTTARPTSRTVPSQTPPAGVTSGPDPNTAPTPCTPSADIVTCEARGMERLIPEMNSWCLSTCKAGHCNPNFCACFCKYPGYKIEVDPKAFDLKRTTGTQQSSMTPSAGFFCYRPTSLWTRVPGFAGWCKANCPSQSCAGRCWLQACS